MRYIVENEGPTALFKGIGPQILKGVLVQGLLMMIKERYVIYACFLATHAYQNFRNTKGGITFCPSLRLLAPISDRQAAKGG